MLATSIARADLAPPDGYKERCTLERKCPEGKQCVLCQVTYEDFAACRELGALGFAKACKSWGASAYHEIWCRDAPDGAKSEITLATDGGTTQLPATSCEAGADSSCSCRAPGARSPRGAFWSACGLLVATLSQRLRTRQKRARKRRGGVRSQ